MKSVKPEIPPAKEWKKVSIIAWQIISIVTLCIFLLFILPNKSILLENIPTCQYKLQGKECLLCGSTQAFYQIKEMNFKKAYNLNQLIIVFFIIFVVNIVIFILYQIQKIKQQIY